MFIRQFRRRLLLSSSCRSSFIPRPFFSLPATHGLGWGGNGDSEGLPSSFPPLASPVSFTSLPSCYSQDHPFLPLLSFSSFSFQVLCSRKNYSWRGKSTFGAFFWRGETSRKTFASLTFQLGLFVSSIPPTPIIEPKKQNAVSSHNFSFWHLSRPRRGKCPSYLWYHGSSGAGKKIGR